MPEFRTVDAGNARLRVAVEGEGPQVAFPVGHSDPSDTGVRRGPAGAGGPIAGLSAAETISTGRR